MEYSRLDKQNISFSWNGVRVWNRLPVETHHMSKTNFKGNIQRMLLPKFLEAGDYIDLPDLIKTELMSW